MRWKRRIQPKTDQQILGTRRFTKLNSFELRPFYTVSPMYRRAVSLCTEMHCFSRLFQDCGPLERASKLKFSAAT